MGAVVPVSEPEWSGAHHGLCLYASRVLQAVWDEQVCTYFKLSYKLGCQASTPRASCRRCGTSRCVLHRLVALSTGCLLPCCLYASRVLQGV